MPLPDPALFLAFLAAALALNLTPGPDMAFIASASLARGRKAGLLAAFGVAAGLLVHTFLVAVGLSSLLLHAPLAFEIVRYLGAAYLVWLARRLLAERDDGVQAAEPRLASARLFRDGALTNILNPKVALFFLAFLPQFVEPAKGALAWQMFVLGLAFNVSGTIVNCIVAASAGAAGGMARRSRALGRWLRRLAAFVFVGLAVRLALAERP
ncbi:MAG: LysE family translocator [Pseudomonadota bacterium]